MPKKILSQTLRRTRSLIINKLNEPQPNSWIKIKDFVVTLGAATGILAGVLWMGGRFYAYGYFERMNIPLYFLSFSTAEYAETYVTSIIGNIFSYISSNFQTIFIGIALAIVIGLILRVIQNRYKKLKIRETIEKIDRLNNRFLVVFSCILFLLSFIAAYNNGSDAAYHAMTDSRSITIYSKDLLPLGTPSITTAPDQKSYLYEFTDLYLLTYNNGKYYLFSEFDLTDCKPKRVYIISDSSSISVNMGNTSPLPQCTIAP